MLCPLMIMGLGSSRSGATRPYCNRQDNDFRPCTRRAFLLFAILLVGIVLRVNKHTLLTLYHML